MDNLLFAISALSLVILLLIYLLKKIRQPYIIAYMLAGVLLGPGVSGVFTSPASVQSVGEIGILLLMFFLGMEIEVPDRKTLLLTPITVQATRTVLGSCIAAATGLWLGWPAGAMVVFTVLLTFNSTAVVSEFLRKRGDLRSPTGKVVLNTLLLQDVLLAPVLIVLQCAAHQALQPVKLMAAACGAIVMLLLLRAIRNRNLYQLPFVRAMAQDHDLQVFGGAAICLGFALLASVAGLSAPIGSFAAGIFIGRTNAFAWLEQVLQPFKVFFTALFFVAVGITLDLHYLAQHWLLIAGVTAGMLLLNTGLAAGVFYSLRLKPRSSLYAGALLSQTGEFGILVCTVAHGMGMLTDSLYKTGICITALSLLLSTTWMHIIARRCYPSMLQKSNAYEKRVPHIV